MNSKSVMIGEKPVIYLKTIFEHIMKDVRKLRKPYEMIAVIN
jgi:hypothetical protein